MLKAISRCYQHKNNQCPLIIRCKEISNGLALQLNKNIDLTIYVHSVDDEFWIQFKYFPTLSTNIRLSVNSLTDVSFGTLQLTRKEVIRLNTDTVPCKAYDIIPNHPHFNFIDCSKNFFRNLPVWSKLGCLMPGFRDLVPDSKIQTLKSCSNKTEAELAHQVFLGVKWKAASQVSICYSMFHYGHRPSIKWLKFNLTLAQGVR